MCQEIFFHEFSGEEFEIKRRQQLKIHNAVLEKGEMQDLIFIIRKAREKNTKNRDTNIYYMDFEKIVIDYEERTR